MAVLAMAAIAGSALAQDGGFRRTILQQVDLAAPGYQGVTAISEFDAGATAPRHTHPGEEIGYVLEGSLTVNQAGKAPMTVAAGHAFVIPAGTVHGATNATGGRTRVLVTYVVEKGQPLSTPAK